ncbi:MAG: prolyl oligopeptidase family serine peptidase [Verrucomicrobiota bacterium]
MHTLIRHFPAGPWDRWFLWLVLCVLAVASRADAGAPPLIPVEKFFDDPAIASVQIAPGGRHVAFRAPMQGRMGLALMDLETGKVEPLVRAADENIDTFIWKSDEHIVFVADVGGNEADAIQSISIKTRRVTRLLESYGENNVTRQDGQWGGVLTWWITNPRKLIVSGSKEKSDWSRGIYEVDVVTGRRTSVGGDTAEKNRLGLQFDNTGRIRVQVIDTQEEFAIEARLGEDQRFTRLLTRPRDINTGLLDHATILADNETLLFVDYSRHDRGALVSWSLRTGRINGELFVPPEGEITGLLLSRDKTVLLGVNYEGDKPHVHWFDAGMAALQASLDQTFPGTRNSIVGMSDDRKKFVITVRSDVESGINFLLDRSRPQPKLMPLGSARPTLESKHLARMEVVRFQARDGLELQGYLTKPPGASGPQPLILLPHGGPYGIRDTWGYDPEVQFLANRGYAVLQLNYRGSGGLGRKHLEAGRLEWGRRMQDDLTDAVQWAVRQGVADPGRVAIYGASYGGYAAMAGVTFTPELYRCAINYVGAVDLTYLGRRDQGGDRIMNEIFFEKWVHPDMEELRRRSPVNHVAAITVPTLHAYGENDPRVEYRHWKKLKAELDKHHKPYEVFNQEDEGHGFSNAPARVRFYLKMEEFLGKHMPARS